jgi:NTE family protein
VRAPEPSTLVGALDAIAAESGWDPGDADHIVGTSAASMVGALLACGLLPWLMVAHSAGEPLDGLLERSGEPVPAGGHWRAASYRLHSRRPALGPGSWRLALGSLARPYRHPPAALWPA